MPYYKPLKDETSTVRKRTITGIKRLREQLSAANFPTKKTSESLILGTWNIRDFDNDKFDYGPRETESIYYIAEIISRFDVLAVQEINEDLYPLKRLMRALGGSYKYIVSDVTDSQLGGNGERLGFIYDSNKVRFQGTVGEIVLPKKMMIEEDGTPKRQFSRTPFGVEFQSGWFKFRFSTVHIFFGSNSYGNAKYKRRVGEIEAVAKYLAKEAKKSDSNEILVGDFNIIREGSDGSNALKEAGFTSVRNRKGSNRDRTKFYDQISFMSRKKEVRMMPLESCDDTTPIEPDRVITFFDSVYQDNQFDQYKSTMVKGLERKIKEAQKEIENSTSSSKIEKANKYIAKKNNTMSSDANLRKYYAEWRSFQVSDHYPLWIEIEIDFSDSYLDYLHDWKKNSG